MSSPIRALVVPRLTACSWLAMAAGASAQYQGIAGPASVGHGQFGIEAAVIPDVNGDGKPEVAVAANFQPHGPIILPVEGRGRVFVYSSTNGAFLRTIYAPVFGDPRSWSVAGVPDLDGDAKGDLAIGVPGQHAPGGRVHLYSVASGAWRGALQPPVSAAGLSFGASVAGVSDMNGDGRGDVLVGATFPVATALPPQSGRVVLMSGATGATLRIFTPAAATADPSFGRRVLSIPDVNSDGKADVVVGAHGSVHIYSGATGARIRTITGPAFPAPLVTESPVFGHSIASVPDVNADGVADLVISNPTVDVDFGPMLPAFAPEAGAVFVYSGKTGQLLRTILGPPLGGGRFGFSVAGLPDLTGDGRGDLFIGAPANQNFYQAGGISPGAAYIYNGATGARVRSLGSPNDELGGRFGQTVLAMPDTNGNGRADLFIAAPYEDPDGQTFRNIGRGYFLRD